MPRHNHTPRSKSRKGRKKRESWRTCIIDASVDGVRALERRLKQLLRGNKRGWEIVSTHASRLWIRVTTQVMEIIERAGMRIRIIDT